MQTSNMTGEELKILNNRYKQRYKMLCKKQLDMEVMGYIDDKMPFSNPPDNQDDDDGNILKQIVMTLLKNPDNKESRAKKADKNQSINFEELLNNLNHGNNECENNINQEPSKEVDPNETVSISD